MILTKQQLEPLLKELGYDYNTSISYWFQYYLDIDFCIRVNDQFVLNFNTPKEELVFTLKYSHLL